MEQVEWDALSVEEQEQRIAEKPTSSSSGVKEDVVIIDGKPRPLKNFLAERERKLKEEILREIDARPVVPQPAPQPQGNWEEEVNKMAEKEMEETGRTVPLRTLTSVANQITQYQITQYASISKQANKIIKDVKRELKSQYKDYSDYEDEFEEIIENTDPKFISKEGLVIVFNSLRGKKLDEIVKVREDKAREDALKDKKILGEVTASGGTPASGRPPKLTDEQRKEMVNMGFESEESYLGRLAKMRKIAKDKNAKNIPELINEPLRF